MNRRLFLGSAALALAGAAPPETIADALRAAVSRGEVPGAVALLLRDDKTIIHEAVGDLAVEPKREPMRPDAIFDLASLTKPVATSTAIGQLIERGKLALADRVSAHWPAFGANGKAAVTLEQLLVHTSGLIADNPVADYADGPAKALERVAALNLVTPPGEKFTYSDVNFVTLGHLVERLSGRTLDAWTRDEIFTPLKMPDTGFTPTPTDRSRLVPTERLGGAMRRGTVHDPRAALMGGVAGHAGLFGTAADLGRFCRMLLSGGELDGARVLSAESVRTMVRPRPLPASGSRALGWDVDTSFSTPRGGFPVRGVGHTGFTGTSVWIDPPTGSAIVLLTSRLHPAGKGNATPLRRRVGTLAAGGR